MKLLRIIWVTNFYYAYISSFTLIGPGFMKDTMKITEVEVLFHIKINIQNLIFALFKILYLG